MNLILETPRLSLRPLTLADLDALAPMYADPDIRRHFPEGTQTREQTRDEIAWIMDGQYGQYGYGLWATILKDTGAFIGRCGLIPWQQPGRLEVEVAYLLDKPYWGKGLATEAARGIVDYAFTTLKLPKVVCYMWPANKASERVAQKAGLSFEREMVDAAGVTLVYAIGRGG